MKLRGCVLALFALLSLRPAGAYIDAIEIIHPEFFTLPMLWQGNVSIAVLTVQRTDPQTGKFLCEAAEWLKGKQEGVKFKFWLPITELKELKVGAKGVLFFGGDAGRDRAILFFERSWILVAPLKEDPSWWSLFRVQPEIKCVFSGVTEDLATSIKKLVAEGEVVVSCNKEPRAPELHQVRYFMSQKHRRRLVPASGQTVALLLKEAGTVAKLIPKLKDADPGVRGIAVDAIASFGHAAKEAVPALAEVLKDPERINRWAAAEALQSIGPAAEEAVPALARALTEKYPMAVETIRRALPRIDRDGKRAIPILLDMMSSPDQAVRWAASTALKANGNDFRPATPVVEKALKHPSGLIALSCLNLRSNADLSKGELGRTAVATLSPSLKDPFPGTRLAAISVMSQLGAVDSMVPALRTLLQDSDPHVRKAALQALCGSKDLSVVLAAIQDKLSDPEVASAAIESAAHLGPKGEPLVPRLAEILLQGTDGYLRFLSTGALARTCVAGKPELLDLAVPALVHGLKLDLKDQYQGVPLVSAEALFRLGPLARAAAPGLLEVIREKEENPYRMKARLTAAAALARVDPSQAPTAVAYLVETIQKSPNPGHRLKAIIELGNIGPDARASLPVLEDVLKGPAGNETRDYTVEAVKRIQGK